MGDKRRQLTRKSVHSNTDLPYHALLVQAVELIITLFDKKNSQDNFSHLKEWEREKIINLGLTNYPLRSSGSIAKDIHFSSWDREKVSNFGLSASATYKKPARIHPPSEQKQTDQKQTDDDDLSPKISYKNNPAQAWKKKRDQSKPIPKNDNLADDFFKILGYE